MSNDARLQLVLTYIETAQRARAERSPAGWDAVRRFLAPDVVFEMAGPCTDEPWRVVVTGQRN